MAKIRYDFGSGIVAEREVPLIDLLLQYAVDLYGSDTAAAEALHVSRQSLHAWRTGRAVPCAERLEDLARRLKLRKTENNS